MNKPERQKLEVTQVVTPFYRPVGVISGLAQMRQSEILAVGQGHTSIF